MVVASGIGSQLSYGKESTYGTAVSLAKFLSADKVSIKRNLTIVQGGGFQGQLLPLGARRKVTTKDNTGTIDTQVFNRGMGLFLQNLMGTSVTPVQQGGTTAYKQTHAWADNYGKSLTIQSSVPSTDGTANPYTYAGCKFPSAEFTFNVGESMAVTWDVDARSVTEATAVPAASYTASTYQFVGTDSSITIGSYSATSPSTTVVGVPKVTLKFERPMKTDRYYLGSAGLKAEPIMNDFGKISGVITADFVDKTLWADRFINQSGFSLQITMTGAAIGSSGYNDTFQVTLPCCFIDEGTPTVEGPDVVSGDFPFTVVYDSTNYPTIVVISDESAL